MGGLDKQVAEEAEEITEENLQQIEEFLLNEEETEEEREARLLEERRRRREEILRKHANGASTGEQYKPLTSSAGPPPETGEDTKDEDDDEKSSFKPQHQVSESARRTLILLCQLASRDVVEEAEALMAEREAVEAEEKREATISFDIFSSSPTNALPLPTLGRRARRDALLEGEDPLLQSNWDDGEGYYKTRIGEIICDRCVLPPLPCSSDLALAWQVPHHGRGGQRGLLDCPQMSRLAPHRPLL
jgi:hypothetical protein